MIYTLLIVCADLPPAIYHSDNKERLIAIVKDLYLSSEKVKEYYIFMNNGSLSVIISHSI